MSSPSAGLQADRLPQSVRRAPARGYGGDPQALVGRKIAAVSLPFFTPFASCYPAHLLASIATAAGAQARTFAAHTEFAKRFVRSDERLLLYNKLTHVGFLSDALLLPLLIGWSAKMTPEVDAFAAKLDSGSETLRGQVREELDLYIDELASELLKFDCVALTATHYQLVPSLVMAQRLRRLSSGSPSPRILLGGYFASQRNATALLSKHDCVDALVYGEAEDVFVDLVLGTGQSGEVARGGATRFRRALPRQDDALAAAMSVPWIQRRYRVSVELSRGCYWDQCDFCNFNAAYDLRFKRHPYADVLAEMDRLAHDLGVSRFQFLDTAVPVGFAKFLRDSGTERDWDVFMELRPDFSLEDLSALKRLGTLRLQIGVESFVDSHLLRMNKRATVGDNVRALRFCQQLGIDVTYGLLVGHPEEDVGELELMRDRIWQWSHLPAPKYLSVIELRAGSDLLERQQESLPAESFPCSAFELVMPLSASAADLLPVNQRRVPRPTRHRYVIDEIFAAVRAWQHDLAPRILGVRARDGSCVVVERRQEDGAISQHAVRAPFAVAVLQTTRLEGRSLAQLEAELEATAAEIERTVGVLESEGLVFRSVRRLGLGEVVEALVEVE